MSELKEDILYVFKVKSGKLDFIIGRLCADGMLKEFNGLRRFELSQVSDAQMILFHNKPYKVVEAMDFTIKNHNTKTNKLKTQKS